MRVRLIALTLLFLVVAACDGMPTRPAATDMPFETPPPPWPANYNWTLTTTLVGGTGPAECATGPRVGARQSYPLGVELSPGKVKLILDPGNWPTDHWADYEGTVTSPNVTATGHYYGYDLCGGGNVQGIVNYGIPSTFGGAFSEDGRQLTGREVRTATSEGRMYTYELDWNAVGR